MTYAVTHTRHIIKGNDWQYTYDEIRKIYKIPSYAAMDISYNKTTNETLLKFTWTTIERGDFI